MSSLDSPAGAPEWPTNPRRVEDALAGPGRSWASGLGERRVAAAVAPVEAADANFGFGGQLRPSWATRAG